MFGAGSYAYEAGPTAYDPFDDRAVFELMYCAWPRRCYITGRILFLTMAVRGRRVIHGLAGESPVIEDRWYNHQEHLLMLLKKV